MTTLSTAVRAPLTAERRHLAGITFIAALGATISGTVFLLGGQSNGALYGMEGLGGLALLGALLMIIFGSVKVGSTPPAPP